MRVIATLLIFGPLSPACAYSVCQAPGPRLVCAEYFRSKAVVKAELIRKQAIIDKDGIVSANIYYMRTNEVLRGSIDSGFEIYEGNDSGRAGFYWKTGHTYLLFLFRSVETKRAAWALDGCGNSGPLKETNSVLPEIQGLANHRGGMIQVAVGEGSISSPVKGALTVAMGTDRSFSGITNENGRSEIHVPPGRYSVKVKGDRAYEPYFLGYEQPNNIQIQNGSCAQVQFVETETIDN
jgi:hypothetical protein